VKLAEHDHQADDLEDSSIRFMFRSVKELIEDLGDEYGGELAPHTAEDGPYRKRSHVDGTLQGSNIACIPASSGADELVAAMLAQLLRHAGFRAREIRAGLPEAMLAEVSQRDYGIACVSSISPFAVSEGRSVCRRLRAISPGLRIVMGLWSFDSDTARQRLGPACSGLVSTTLSDALTQIRQLADPTVPVESLSESSSPQKLSA
jgi:hypothetical protein